MNRRLSSRILLPNLIIVFGSLLLLVLAILFSVRVFMQEETTKEFRQNRVTVDRWIRSAKDDPQSNIDTILYLYPWIFSDVKVLVLTDDLKYPEGAAEQPLPESILAQVKPGDAISEIQYEASSYFATAIPYVTAEGRWNMLLYKSLDKRDALIRRLVLNMQIALAGATLVAVLASIFASRRIADPLQKLSQWARGISGRQYGRFDLRSGTAEIDFLADSLNGMVKRMEDYDSAQKIFLQNASHELRTPLMSIQGYAEGIKHGVFSDTANAADIIVSESLRLSALVDDLLYLSKLEMTDGFYVFAPTSLGEVLYQCAEKLEGVAIKENKTIALLPCPDAVISGDGEKLLRAVMNLAGNCLRYAEKTVEMSVAQSDGCAVITVSDDGPGFEPEDMKNLFTRFYKGKQGKYGLGLSIAKTIVEKHGGTISAHNGSAGGAVFTIELPLVHAHKEQ